MKLTGCLGDRRLILFGQAQQQGFGLRQRLYLGL